MKEKWKNIIDVVQGNIDRANRMGYPSIDGDKAILWAASRLSEMEAEVGRLQEECLRQARQLKYYQDAVCFDPPRTWWKVSDDVGAPAIETELLSKVLRERESLRSRLALADKLLRGALENIVNAKRFSRDHFRDDTEFANWVRSRSRAALSAFRKG